MICPYNNHSVIFIEVWSQGTKDQSSDDSKKGSTVNTTIYERAECVKENCGAWNDGRCFKKGSEEMNEDEMTTKEVSRLIDWLKEHGHTYEEIEQCIDYISKEKSKANDVKMA